MGSPSDQARPGVFRLNSGVAKAAFERPTEHESNPDYAALDQILPHPVYPRQRWIAILNPSQHTFDAVVEPLIAEASERLAKPARRRVAE
jgi:hypothetical protein